MQQQIVTDLVQDAAAVCNYIVFQVHWSFTNSCHAFSVQTGSAATTKKISLLEMCVSSPPQRGKRTSTTITPNLSVSFSNT